MLKTCNVYGCNKPHKAKGFCNYHYIKARRDGKTTDIKCKVDGCETNFFAKGYCYTHWVQFRKNGDKLYQSHKCQAEGCSERTTTDYCHFHKIRVCRGMHLDATASELMSGPNNWNWRGGKSQYTNHSEFKRQRKIKLRSVNYTCQLCGDIATEVHHKDGLKVDHRQENLEALCHHCHMSNYHSQNHTSKYKKHYGVGIKELCIKVKSDPSRIRKWHEQGILSKILSGEMQKPVRYKSPNGQRTSRGNRLTKFKRIYGNTLKELSVQLRVSPATVRNYHLHNKLRTMLDQIAV